MPIPVYIQHLQGFYNPKHPKKVWLLKQSLYGTRQAHREFNSDLAEKLNSIGLKPSSDAPSLFTMRTGSSFIHIHMNVDNGLVFPNSKTYLHEIKCKLHNLYKLIGNSEPTIHLGIKIACNQKLWKIHLSQEHYLTTVLDIFDMTNCNTSPTPFPTNLQLILVTDDETVNSAHLPYQQVVGCLNWAAVHTHREIKYTVSTLSRYSSKYTESHWKAAKHRMRNIQGSISVGILFQNHWIPSYKI